jgi:hypothetical protein
VGEQFNGVRSFFFFFFLFFFLVYAGCRPMRWQIGLS